MKGKHKGRHSMTEPDRRTLLERLHEQLGEVEPADEKGQQLLDDTRAQIQRTLDEDDEHDTLVERLEDALSHFEGTHPDLTSAITVVIDSLSNMGL
jgi:hypothetical protein